MLKRRTCSTKKNSRLSIRVDPKRKAVIFRAAKQYGYTLSEFIRENIYQLATELLTDEDPIALSKKQVAFVFEILDNPPTQSLAALRKLLDEESILAR